MVLIGFAVLLGGCGGGSSTPAGSPTQPPAITASPVSQVATAGEAVAFAVAATGTAPLHYQWQKGGAAVGADASTYALAAVTPVDAGTFTVVVSNAAGSVVSAAASLTVTATQAAPAITGQSTSQQVTAGSAVVLLATATGTAPLQYQWQKDGTVVGGDAASYAIASAQATDAGSYTVTVSNAAGSVTSSAMVLTVTAAVDWKGLTAAEEAYYYLNPNQLSTAGDGISDFDKIKTYGFDPSNDPYKFNPLLAEVPTLKIQLTSPPMFSINFTYTDGTTASTSTERSAESSQSVTLSQESSLGLSVEATAKLETDSQGVEGTVGVENVFTTSAEQASENSQALAVAQEQELDHEVSSSGAKVQLTVSIQNTGHLAFTMTNLVLGGITVDPNATEIMYPFGNLEYQPTSAASAGGFPATTIAPGGSITGLTFANNLMYVDTVMKMLGNSRDLHVGISLYELINPATGIPYNAQMTEIDARTATVLIDYDTYSGRDAEQFLVATDLVDGASGVSLQFILEHHLYIPYVVDTINGHTGLRQLRTYDYSATDHANWVISHQYLMAGTPVTDIFDIAKTSYDLGSILVKAGDVVGLTYVVDKDGDGLPHRLERALGTSDLLVNSNPNSGYPSDYAWYMAGHPLNDPVSKHQVIYNANGATVGLVPSDLAYYASGQMVQVADNTGGLGMINVNGMSYGFTGWNTQPDGSGSNWNSTKPIIMGDTDVNLYAMWAAYNVKDIGPAGGVIFYKKDYYSDGWRYMEAAPQDFPLNVAWVGMWSPYRFPNVLMPGAQGYEVGDGVQNTADIEAAETSYQTAADVCANYVLGRYKDWFLPSFMEMSCMTIPQVGLNPGLIYWTSTQKTDDPSDIQAWTWSAALGSVGFDRNVSTYGPPPVVGIMVRPVRRF